MLRRTVPLVIVFLAGFVMVLEYFLGYSFLKEGRELFAKWARLGFTAAVVVGIFNLIIANLGKIVRRQRGWVYNAALIAMLFVGAVPGVLMGWDRGVTFWVFNWIYQPGVATMFGLLAFFIASAAFRAFRARNVEAVLLLVSAVIVILGNVTLFRGSVGASFGWMKDFVMQVPMTGAQRAVLIAAATGAIFFSLKVLTGVDRSYFGGRE